MARNLIEKLTHHAYCLIGTALLLDELVRELESEHKIARSGNPDFHAHSYQNLLIGDARSLISFHDVRPVHPSGKKIVMIHADAMTIEAQNALLKLLEEPADYAHFFIIVPSRHILIPTIQSRLFFIDSHKTSQANEVPVQELRDLVSLFLKSPVAKRLEMIKKIVDDISDEKRAKRFAIDFIDVLEKEIHDARGTKGGFAALEATQFARSYLYDRAPSLKMLLEYVAMRV